MRIGATIVKRHATYRQADEAVALTRELARRVGLPVQPKPPPFPPIIPALAALFADNYDQADEIRLVTRLHNDRLNEGEMRINGVWADPVLHR